MGLDLSDHSEIWQVPQQLCCRRTCQISKWYNHFNTQSRSFKTWRDGGGKTYYRSRYRPCILHNIFLNPPWYDSHLCWCSSPLSSKTPMLALWTCVSSRPTPLWLSLPRSSTCVRSAAVISCPRDTTLSYPPHSSPTNPENTSYESSLRNQHLPGK